MDIGTRVVVTGGRWVGLHGTVTDYGDDAWRETFIVEWDKPNMLEGILSREFLRHESTFVPPLDAGRHTLDKWLDA